MSDPIVYQSRTKIERGHWSGICRFRLSGLASHCFPFFLIQAFQSVDSRFTQGGLRFGEDPARQDPTSTLGSELTGKVKKPFLGAEVVHKLGMEHFVRAIDLV
jgi:hypothetical protein